jgi:hypothetical protein
MKKLSALALALLLGITGVVFAADKYKTTNDVTLDGTTYPKETTGQEVIENYSYGKEVTINGTKYPKEATFKVLLKDGVYIPLFTDSSAIGAVAATGAAAGAAAGTTVVATTVGVVFAAAVLNNKGTPGTTGTAGTIAP